MYILKKYWYLLLIVIVCVAGYYVAKYYVGNSLIEKEIVYKAPKTVNEASIVWGINYLQMPPEAYWPKGSLIKDKLVETKLVKRNGVFSTKIKLPANTQLDYWIIQKTYENGKLVEIWDQGRPENEHYTLYFHSQGFFRPGYFLFLAGLIPMIVLFKNRKQIFSILTKQPPVEVKEYVKQFDSLRAIAVLLVIFHHWFPRSAYVHHLHFGAMGVDTFFVLSGFLISRILFNAKNQVEKKQLTNGNIFKSFYLRRSLRIFPIYYLLLFILWALKNDNMKNDGVYYFTYTSNLLFFSQQFFPTEVAHLWSLAVEEQFYLIWPWLIVLVKKKYLLLLIGIFILVGVTSNYIFTEHDQWVIIFTPACFDAFGIGALLAYIVVYQSWFINTLQRKFKLVASLFLIIFLLAMFNLSFLPDRTVHALLAGVILYYCLFRNNLQILNYILNSRFLIALGKISYGVYLYHMFIPDMWEQIVHQFSLWNIDLFYNAKMPEAFKPVWLFIQEFAFLIVICFISWKLVEKPILSLKKYFEYMPKTNNLKNLNSQVQLTN